MRSDEETLAALRRGDEGVFVELVRQHQALMLRVAWRYVRNRTVAEEVVQETWLAVLSGLGGFEGRASVKTWIFRILVNRAITRAQREGRAVPFSSLGGDRADEPAVDPDRFRPADDRYAGGWKRVPEPLPEERLLARETLGLIEAAIAGLPERQSLVIMMRDVEGWSSEQVCQALSISEANQRVLLHRARSKVRSCLESYLDPAPALT
ncbi:MAG: sigma-70 family RNA polymerase sigma factor [Solirubrobacteraceae bacterium]